MLDFSGDVDWKLSEPAREWYARMKSRPSFRALLADRVPGMTPPEHYADLDFLGEGRLAIRPSQLSTVSEETADPVYEQRE